MVVVQTDDGQTPTDDYNQLAALRGALAGDDPRHRPVLIKWSSSSVSLGLAVRLVACQNRGVFLRRDVCMGEP